MSNAHVPHPYTQHSPEIRFTPTNNLRTDAPPLSYGQQYAAAPPEHPQGTMILIFGIIGIFFSLFGAIAWYLGANAMREVRATGIRYSNESNINTGRILGKIVTIIALVGLGIAFLLWLLFGLIFAVRLTGL
jgi:hypothetical protein